MSSVWNRRIAVSLFGESHGPAVGVVIDGLPSGVALDMDEIAFQMRRRAPGRSALATARAEADAPEILSGVFEGRTTGTALAALVRNGDTHSGDYSELRTRMRPGHADYTGKLRYAGANDHRGGGHFSGRLTAALVFAGAVCRAALSERGVAVGAHIERIRTLTDRRFAPEDLTAERFQALAAHELPVLNAELEDAFFQQIADAKAQGDSVGGVIECVVTGLPAGVGDPFFDSVESVFSHILFSVPAVKGVEFGAGFGIAQMFGSQANDAFYYDENGGVRTRTNYNGGVLGGITTGMPVVFRAALKPTPSIAKEQDTIDLARRENVKLTVRGRHDPCIVPRAVPVIEAAAAIAALDILMGRQEQTHA